MHFAARDNHDFVAKILLNAGADTNAKNTEGLTPSELAAKDGHKNLAQLLSQKNTPLVRAGRFLIGSFVRAYS